MREIIRHKLADVLAFAPPSMTRREAMVPAIPAKAHAITACGSLASPAFRTCVYRTAWLYLLPQNAVSISIPGALLVAGINWPKQ